MRGQKRQRSVKKSIADVTTDASMKARRFWPSQKSRGPFKQWAVDDMRQAVKSVLSSGKDRMGLRDAAACYPVPKNNLVKRVEDARQENSVLHINQTTFTAQEEEALITSIVDNSMCGSSLTLTTLTKRILIVAELCVDLDGRS